MHVRLLEVACPAACQVRLQAPCRCAAICGLVRANAGVAETMAAPDWCPCPFFALLLQADVVTINQRPLELQLLQAGGAAILCLGVLPGLPS